MASWKTPFDPPATDHSRGESSNTAYDEAPWPFQAHDELHEYRHLAQPTGFPSTLDPYPVINTSASSSSAGNVGRFVHSQCDQELFNVEYLRSNKASGHKNLRCFPHCCGGHNPKSFCGSGLVVECALPNAQIALGRFEELVKSPHTANNANTTETANNMPVTNTNVHHSPTSNNQLEPDLFNPTDRIIIPGRSYNRHDLFRELKSTDNPFGMWFKGTAVANANAPTLDAKPRFHLNGNRASWHYGWQSSRLNCKNLHVFRVYFFQELETNESSKTPESNEVLTCIASVSSPPFRISSSRKARKTFKSSPSTHSLADSVSGDEHQQIPMPQTSPSSCTDDHRLSLDGSASTATSTLRSRSSFDLGLGPGFGVGGGDVLPSLSSRLSRAATTATTMGEPFSGSSRPYYRGQPDRKRLTRSASLQTDYYSSSPSGLSDSTRQPRARTFPGDETKPSNQLGRPRMGMMSMDSLLNASPPTYAFATDPDFRPSLPPITVPPLTTLGHFHHQLPPVTTPVTDMMQLQLNTPRGHFPRSLSASSDLSLDFGSLRPPPVPLASPTEYDGHHPRRKRNRSADSGSHGQSLDDGDAWNDGPLMMEIAAHGDWDLVAQAYALGVLVAIASRLQLSEDPIAAASTSYRIVGKPAAMVTISAERAPALARMCDVLVLAASRLIHDTSFLADLRANMHALVHSTGRDQQHRPQPHDDGRACKHLMTLYESMLTFVLPRVEAQIAHAFQRQQPTNSPAKVPTNQTPSPIIDLIRSAEQELVTAPWWRDVVLFDDDNDEYPFMDVFKSYYEAVRASAAYAPLALPTDSLNHRSLSGDWRLLTASLDELDTTQASSALDWTRPAWLQQQLTHYAVQKLRVVETTPRLSLTLDHSVVSPASPIIAELDQRDPVVWVPVDHLPFALTRRHLMVAHRAWREADGTTIAVQMMQWPTEAECRLVGARRELLRTRVAMYFSVVSPVRLDVRCIVEGSMTEEAKLCAMAFAPPNDSDMREYFEAPSASPWATLSHSSLSYERI